MKSETKRREFWLYDNGEEPFLAYHGLGPLKEDTPGSEGQTYHVTELKAGDIVISLKEFQDAYQRAVASRALGSNKVGPVLMRGLVERELFGPKVSK